MIVRLKLGLLIFYLRDSLILLLSVASIDAHRQCAHSPPKANEVNHHVHLEPFHVIRKRSADQRLRVYLYYDESVNSLSPKKYELINSVVLPQAVKYWEQTLMLRPNNIPIRLNRRCKTDSVFHRENSPYPYCRDGCSNLTMCGEVPVPEDHLEVCRFCDNLGMNCREQGVNDPNGGIKNADFVFYISAMNTSRCNKKNVVAYAAHCAQEVALDRPIAGHANLCPDSISMKTQELETLISTVKHEMLHALGFSVSLYAFYRDKNGAPLTERGANGKPIINESDGLYQWSERVIKRVDIPGWKVRNKFVTRSMQLMVTPRVIEETQRHFSCPFVEGAELEDQGGEGTALTHWEKRIFENEAMTGTHTQNPVYSRITLALMEDTGWYTPNYTMAEHLAWGQNLGCDFVLKSCKEWIDTKLERNERIDPFCRKVKKDPPQTECMSHRKAVALCNLVEYNNELPQQYQNFDTIQGIPKEKVGLYGGSVDLADFCPYLQEFTWKSQSDAVTIRGSQCQYEENNPKPVQNFALENYGSSSRCYDHGPKMWEEKSCTQLKVWQHWGSGCYESFCSEGRLHVKVLDYNYTCFQTKQLLHIQLSYGGSLHVGSIICPSCDEICGQSEMKCLPDEQPSSSYFYHQDSLPCSGTLMVPSFLLRFLGIYFIMKELVS